MPSRSSCSSIQRPAWPARISDDRLPRAPSVAAARAAFSPLPPATCTIQGRAGGSSPWREPLDLEQLVDRRVGGHAHDHSGRERLRQRGLARRCRRAPGSRASRRPPPAAPPAPAGQPLSTPASQPALVLSPAPTVSTTRPRGAGARTSASVDDRQHPVGAALDQRRPRCRQPASAGPPPRRPRPASGQRLGGVWEQMVDRGSSSAGRRPSARRDRRPGRARWSPRPRVPAAGCRRAPARLLQVYQPTVWTCRARRSSSSETISAATRRSSRGTSGSPGRRRSASTTESPVGRGGRRRSRRCPRRARQLGRA